MHQTLSLTFSLDSLTPADVVALCAHAQCPLPTPDVGLAECLRMVGLTAQSLHESLRDTTDVRLMIAAAAIRGVTRLPRDPRLDPLPHPPTPGRAGTDRAAPSTRSRAPAGTRASAAPASAPASSWTTEHVLTHVEPCPKRPGSASWDRYQLYVTGQTVAQLLASGVRRADLVWDLERRFLVLTAPDQLAAPEAESGTPEDAS